MAYQNRKKSGQESDTALQALKQAISTGNPGNLYIFYGEEVYLRNHYLDMLRKKILSGGLEEFSYYVLQAKDCSVHALRELVDTVPLMGERTLIVVHDYDIYKGDARTKASMEALFKDLPEYVCLVFLYDVIEYKPDHRMKLAKFVQERNCAVHFPLQGRSQLAGWIARHFRAEGHDIRRVEAEYLMDQCGEQMTSLDAEIGKISAYARERQITRADIDAVVIPQLNARVFELTNYLAAGKYDQAFSDLSDLLRSQEDPNQILGALSWQLRRLYVAKLSLEFRKGTDWVQKTCGIPYRSQAERLLASAQHFSLPWCRQAVLRCEKTDLAMKSSGGNPSELLTSLLLELSFSRTAA